MATDDERHTRRNESGRDASMQGKTGVNRPRGDAPGSDDEARRDDLPHPRTGDAAFANQTIFNTERHQTEDRRRNDVLDEIGEPTTAALPDRTPRAPIGREDPADRHNVGTYEEQADAADPGDRAE